MPSPITVELLSPAFRLLADRTSKQMAPETLAEWAEYFAELRLNVESVYEAVRIIVRDWDGFSWPSMAYVAKVARQKLNEASAGSHEDTGRVLHDICDLTAQRKWDSRSADAEAWFAEHEALGRELVAEIDHDLAALMRRVPAGSRLATSQAYRKAFRDGAIIGACIRQMAIGHTRGAKKEARERAAKLNRPALELAS